MGKIFFFDKKYFIYMIENISKYNPLCSLVHVLMVTCSQVNVVVTSLYIDECSLFTS